MNYHMLLEQSATPYRLRWDPLIIMAGEQQRFFQFYTEANAQTVYEFLAFRSDNPNSIVQCITKARENARTIRDRISREMWEDLMDCITRSRGLIRPSRSPADRTVSAMR